MKITYAFCTYNRCNRLAGLVTAIRGLTCPVQFDILAINNNSNDRTLDILHELSEEPGIPLRVITEHNQGIVPARNRAIAESMESEILVFLDDDELPGDGVLEAAYDAIVKEGADCVGGRIIVDFGTMDRPGWLDHELARFLGELDYGPASLWITDRGQPVWSGNVAYRMDIFRRNPDLRFDQRYNRAGTGIGGGEDAVMFRDLLAKGYRVRYRPDMRITHSVEPEKLRKSYFIRLHYLAGLRKGRHELPAYDNEILGIPPFLLRQALVQCIDTAKCALLGKHYMRKAMNVAHTVGMMAGARIGRRERGR